MYIFVSIQERRWSQKEGRKGGRKRKIFATLRASKKAKTAATDPSPEFEKKLSSETTPEFLAKTFQKKEWRREPAEMQEVFPMSGWMDDFRGY
jgi:hypothetical protein